MKFFYAGFVRSNSGTFNTDSYFLNCIGSINGYLVIRLIPGLNTQVIIMYVQFKIRQNKFVFNKLPDNPCHFITVQLNHGISNLNYISHGNKLRLLLPWLSWTVMK